MQNFFEKKHKSWKYLPTDTHSLPMIASMITSEGWRFQQTKNLSLIHELYFIVSKYTCLESGIQKPIISIIIYPKNMLSFQATEKLKLNNSIHTGFDFGRKRPFLFVHISPDYGDSLSRAKCLLDSLKASKIMQTLLMELYQNTKPSLGSTQSMFGTKWAYNSIQDLRTALSSFASLESFSPMLQHAIKNAHWHIVSTIFDFAEQKPGINIVDTLLYMPNNLKLTELCMRYLSPETLNQVARQVEEYYRDNVLSKNIKLVLSQSYQNPKSKL